ncbi:KH domain-containing, RNA-binding, signal transduction-associated protein 2 isoform X2 [Glossina fuscipes]|uniref:KH domain-containing, RNA-binding, signal transduction-associated protein 2 isoform X2 n=1 Tax=Glossina fuscipes TaxID=7396 RepID=A0A9C5ZFT1_9MUSC|nr:KH domain-containing, RNA-binding, signal transduction-associated protein 2 isoform X2 [Glossina fuscipes]
MAENGMRSGLEQSSDSGGGGVGGAAVNGHLNHEHEQGIEKGSARLSEAAQKYMQELLIERSKLENNFPLAVKLIDEALERVQLNGRIPTRDQYADVYQQRTIKLTQKVHVPIKDKKFNYVGKLLGPKGNSLRRLQEETQCKIVILGRFSMKDRAREEELRNSADAKYAHLNLPLHVEVSTIAPPAEAYARIAYALAELRRYLIPDKHDDIRQEQFRELMEDPEAAKKITLRQQQQQQQGNGNGGNGNGNGNNNHRSNNGNYRPKYQQQSQNYHYNDETVYYRSHSNNYHPAKAYVPGGQRTSSMHSTIPPPAIVGASPSGMTVVNATAANYSGRAPGLITGNPVAGNTAGGATVGNPNMRYRPSQLPYSFVKK